MNNKQYPVFLFFLALIIFPFSSGCHQRGTRSLFSFELELKNRGYNGFYFNTGDGPSKLILEPFRIHEILLYVDNEISALVINFFTEKEAEQGSVTMARGFTQVFEFIQKTSGKSMDFEEMKKNAVINHCAVLMYQPHTENPQDEFVMLFKEHTKPVNK